MCRLSYVRCEDTPPVARTNATERIATNASAENAHGLHATPRAAPSSAGPHRPACPYAGHSDLLPLSPLFALITTM